MHSKIERDSLVDSLVVVCIIHVSTVICIIGAWSWYLAGLFADTIDECDSNPCQNYGVCFDRVQGFKCRCEEGWEDYMCQRSMSNTPL